MAAALPRAYNEMATSGTFDSDAAGTDKTGNAVTCGQVMANTLSALVTVEAETDTLTITGRWQVSADNTSWTDCHAHNNAANVILATGTAGADSPVSRAICAPDQVFGYKYCRYTVSNGVATGAATDTYAIGYSFVRRTSATYF